MKALACQLPAELGIPLSRFSRAEFKREVVSRGIVAEVSGSTLWRWLGEDAIRPWNRRSWIFPQDPAFGEKAARALDLYARQWEGWPLGPKEFVLCADEKTQIQIRSRLHPIEPPGPGGCAMRVEHEYERHGVCAYIAAWDVHHARLFGEVFPNATIKAFDAVVAQVMGAEPYGSALRVFWIVDNGTIHRGERAVQRLQERWPNLVLVHLPLHASWLNQIEIYFSILARKALTPDDFESFAAIRSRILGFQEHYQQLAQPFEWKFTKHDLQRLLEKLDTPQRVAA